MGIEFTDNPTRIDGAHDQVEGRIGVFRVFRVIISADPPRNSMGLECTECGCIA